MTEDQNRPFPGFICRRITTHFIYSLAVSRQNVRQNMPAPDGWSGGTPPDRVGIVPHLELKEGNHHWMLGPDREVSLHAKTGNSPPMEGKIRTLRRLFPTSATCTIQFETVGDTRPFHTKDVLAVLNLVTQRKDVPPETGIHLPGAATDRALYSCFLDEIEGSDGICRPSPQIAWVDKDEQLVDTGSETQSPWVVTIAEVNEEVAADFCGPGEISSDPARAKMLRIKQYERDIAPILFRSVSEMLVLEPAYVQPPTPVGVPGLFSVNLDARLFVGMSRRAILCICLNKDQDPAAYFIPGLLDICELVRARWHSLVILNKLLDRTISEIREQVGTRPYRQGRLMEMRARLAACLEDPTLYIVAGDALSKLHADLRDMFRLDELRNTLLLKVDLADKVFSDLQELEWMKAKKMDQP